MERGKSVVAIGEAVQQQRGQAVVIDQAGNYGRSVKKPGSAWTPFFIVAGIALVAWVVFWKINVANMRPAVAAALAPAAASVTAAAAPAQVAPGATKAPAKHVPPKGRDEAKESATPGLDALIAKLNRFLRDDHL